MIAIRIGIMLAICSTSAALGSLSMLGWSRIALTYAVMLCRIISLTFKLFLIERFLFVIVSIMIKAVMFDAGGVLHITNTAASDDLRQELGLSDEQVKKIFSHYVPLLGTAKITEQEVWDELKRDYGIRQVSEDEHLFTRSFVKTLQKMPGMYELVDELKTKGIMVLLLTNVTPQFAEVLQQKGHYDPFDFKVLSYEVGIWKPDIEIYYFALQKLDIKPGEAVFIDDKEKNIVAAQAIGIRGILFQNTEQVKAELSELLK